MAAHRALDGVAGAFPLIDWFMNTNYDRNMYTEEASVVTMRWLLLTHLLLPPFVLSSRRWLAWPSAIALLSSAAYLMHAASSNSVISKWQILTTVQRASASKKAERIDVAIPLSEIFWQAARKFCGGSSEQRSAIFSRQNASVFSASFFSSARAWI